MKKQIKTAIFEEETLLSADFKSFCATTKSGILIFIQF